MVHDDKSALNGSSIQLENSKLFSVATLLLCLVGLLVNIALPTVVKTLGIPLF